MDEATKSPSENISEECETTSNAKKENDMTEMPDDITFSPRPSECCQEQEDECDVHVSDSAKIVSSIFTVEDNLDLTVFVANLDACVTDELLKNFLVREGLKTNDINKVGVIWKFLKNSEELGVTFVELASSIAFEEALTLSGRELSGNNIIIVPALYSHKGLILMNSTSDIKMNDTKIGQNLCIETAMKHTEEIDAKKSIISGPDNLHSNKNDSHQIQDNEVETHTVEDKKDDSSTMDNSKIALPDVCDLTDESNYVKQDESKVIHIDLEDSSVEEIYIAHDSVENRQNIGKDSKKVNDKDRKLATEISTVDKEQTCVPKTNISKSSVSDAISKKQEYIAIIKNLPPDTKEEELKEFFNITSNDIQSVRFLRNARSRRSSERSARAIISFTSEECLNKCLAQTKSLFHYRQIFVEKHNEVLKINTGEKRQNSYQRSIHDKTLMRPSKIKSEDEKVASDTNGKVELDLFVKHVHKNVSDRHLIDFFASAGAVVKKVYRFPDMNKVRGMAFITMENIESILRGLAMNGKMIYGVKIKVCVRNDRTHLMQPVMEDSVVSYSTFIGSLPIKESADSLKNSLKIFFEKSGCAIKLINVPSAVNHSGNRGYAYVSFQNEESLSKCQKLHRSEIVLNNCKYFIDVSKQWPELRVVTPSPTRDRTKETTYSPADSALQARQNKRRRKGTSPLNTWDNKLRSNLKPTMSEEFSQNTCDYPPDQIAVMPDSNSFQSEYKYHDYMDFSDYARKVYDNQAFTGYNSRGTGQCKQDYNSQTITGQQTYSPMAPNSSVPSSLSIVSEPLNIVPKTQLENDMRDYSQYRGRDYMDRMKYEELEQPHLSVSSYKWRDNTDYVVGSHGVSAEADVATSSKVRLNSTPMYRRSDKQMYESASPLYDSRNRYFLDKETNSSYSSTLSGQVPTRNSWFDSSSSDYLPSGSNSFVSVQPSASHSPSGLPPPSIPPVRISNEVPLFSRFDRRSFSYNPLESHSGTNGGMQKYPMPTNATTSRTLNEITHYGHHVLSSEEKRKSSAYENSSSFVSKLAQSGILSNAGYDSYPGVGGYHAN